MTRPMLLAYEGWYPENHTDCTHEIRKCVDENENDNVMFASKDLISVVVPHAGWRFSGKIAINVLRQLSRAVTPATETIVIFGGHLPVYAHPILETFDKAQTPLGYLESDKKGIELLSEISDIGKKEYLQDNSIEVLLPVIRYFFGDIKILCLYLPPDEKIFKILDKLHVHYGNKALYVASTDLTHYGPNYHFTKNTGDLKPVDWVKYVNDHKFIELALGMHEKELIEYALKNSASCSSGTVAAAIYMAKKAHATTGVLYSYATSYEIYKSESFVGYAGILYPAS